MPGISRHIWKIPNLTMNGVDFSQSVLPGLSRFVDLRQGQPAPYASFLPTQMEEVMPVTDVIILTAITAAFVVYALILAWGDYQTRNIRPITRPALKNDDGRAPATQTVVKALADRKAA
jgi:multisubunit Na+/H+ antiporter MnhC subunit